MTPRTPVITQAVASAQVAYLPQPMTDQRLPWPSFEFNAAQRQSITQGGLPRLRLTALAPAAAPMPNAPAPEAVATLSQVALMAPSRPLSGVTGAPIWTGGGTGGSASRSMPLANGAIRIAEAQTATGSQKPVVVSQPVSVPAIAASNAQSVQQQTIYATPSLPPVPQQSPYTAAAQTAGASSISQMSGWSLGLGIAGLLSIWICIGWFLCIAAIVLGHVALYQINRAKLTTWLSPAFRTRAIWGLVLGYGAIIVYIFYIIAVTNH